MDAETKFYLVRNIVLLIIADLLLCIFTGSVIENERLTTIQTNLITASGIISGIIIAYLGAKLFNLKQERQSRQIEIDHLSVKFTNYRRILYCVMRSHDFWTRYSDINKFKKKYPKFDYDRLHSHGQGVDNESYDFWVTQREISTTTIDLYLSMETIYGKTPESSTWIYDRTAKFNYSLDELYKSYYPSNQIWYFLEGRYNKHTHHLINDIGISNLFKNDIMTWFSEIDHKFKKKEFDRRVLAELSTDFHELYLPQLIELTEKNEEKFPTSLQSVFWNLITIFVVGVICPLFIQCLNGSRQTLTLVAVSLVIVGFIKFLFDFYKVMREEIKTV